MSIHGDKQYVKLSIALVESFFLIAAGVALGLLAARWTFDGVVMYFLL